MGAGATGRVWRKLDPHQIRKAPLQHTQNPKFKLEDLLAEIPPGQRFEEVDWGPTIGREILPEDVAEDRSAASIPQGLEFGGDETELPIFMDWEFSDLGPVGELCLPLSVGMITATGASLYLEFATLARPNDFVREHVLPLMTLDDCLTLPAGRRIIVDWLASHNARIVLTSDSDYDLQMLDWVAPEARKNPNRRYVKITDDPTLGLFSVAPSMQGSELRFGVGHGAEHRLTPDDHKLVLIGDVAAGADDMLEFLSRHGVSSTGSPSCGLLGVPPISTPFLRLLTSFRMRWRTSSGRTVTSGEACRSC